MPYLIPQHVQTADFERSDGLAEPHGLHVEDELMSNFPHQDAPHGDGASTQYAYEAFNAQFTSTTHVDNEVDRPAWDEAQRAEMMQRLKDERAALKRQQVALLEAEHAQQVADLLALQASRLARAAEQEGQSRASLQEQLLKNQEEMDQLKLKQAYAIRQQQQQHSGTSTRPGGGAYSTTLR